MTVLSTAAECERPQLTRLTTSGAPFSKTLSTDESACESLEEVRIAPETDDKEYTCGVFQYVKDRLGACCERISAVDMPRGQLVIYRCPSSACLLCSLPADIKARSLPTAQLPRVTDKYGSSDDYTALDTHTQLTSMASDKALIQLVAIGTQQQSQQIPASPIKPAGETERNVT